MQKVASLINIFSPAKPRNFNAHAVGLRHEDTPFLAYALIAVNGFLLLSYLLGVNAQASSGYEIKQLQSQVQKYNEQQKDLNLKLSEATAISIMTEDFQKNGFVQAGQPQFITVNQSTQTAMK